MWQCFALIILDESTTGVASGPWTQDGTTFEARVLNWGRIDRAIPCPAGMPQIADATIRLADTDVAMRRLLVDETFRRRTVEIRLVDQDASPILETPPLFTGEIQSVRFGYGYVEVSLADKLYSWLDEEFPALLTPETVPEFGLTASVFAPVIQGTLEEPLGAVPLNQISSTRWVVAEHPVSITTAVYRKRPDEDEFSLVSNAEYTGTLFAKTFYDLDFQFTFLDFFEAQPEGTEIRVNIKGINERGLFGTMPGVGGVPEVPVRNPIDFFIGMTFFFLRKHGIPDPSVLFATESMQVLHDRFEPGGDLEGYADCAILEPITAREFLSRFLTSFELSIFQDQIGREAGLLTFGVLTDDTTATPVDESLILWQSFQQEAGRATSNEILYRYKPDYILNSWGVEILTSNTEEQRLLGVTEDSSPPVRHLKADREFLEMWYVRDGSTAANSINRRLNFKSVTSYRQRFRLPLPQVRNAMEPCGQLALTHRLGLPFGGYRDRDVKILRTAFDLDSLAVEVDTIVRVPEPPEFGDPDIISLWYDVPGAYNALQKYRVQPNESPNDVRTTFTFNETPLTDTDRVYVNGIYQIPDVDYTRISGGQNVVFTNPPLTGDVIEQFYDVAGTGNLSRPRTVPSGSVDGSNADFVLPETPVTDSERVYVGNFMMIKGTDYSMSTPTTIHFLSGVPQTGDSIYVYYDVVGTRKLRRHRVSPIGPVNGINPLFVIEETPVSDTEEIFVNAMPQFPPNDYSFQNSHYLSTFHPSGSREILFTSSPRRT